MGKQTESMGLDESISITPASNGYVVESVNEQGFCDRRILCDGLSGVIAAITKMMSPGLESAK